METLYKLKYIVDSAPPPMPIMADRRPIKKPKTLMIERLGSCSAIAFLPMPVSNLKAINADTAAKTV